MLKNYEKYIKVVLIFFAGVLIGAMLMGISMITKYILREKELGAEQQALMQEVKLLKREEIYILKYALKQYHEELKKYYEYFDKGGHNEK